MTRFERLKPICTIVMAILALIVLFFGINAVEDRMERKAYEDSEDDEEDDDEYELSEDELLIGNNVYRSNADVRNYLIIGTDATGSTEEDTEYQGNMADFLLVVALNRTDNSYTFLQIDRDTITKVPIINEDGESNASSEMQICTAHWYGINEEQSSENTVTAVSNLLGGLPFEGYYEVNMEQIPMLNHLVGGVTVTVSSDLTNADPALIEGKSITLTDEQAYTYVHARMDVSDGSNEDRMRRQKEYMDAYLAKVIEMTKDDPDFPNKMYQDMKEYIRSDLAGNDLSKILNRMSQGENKGIKTFEGAHKLGQLLDDGLEHQEFYIDHDSFLDVMTDIYDLELVYTFEDGE